MQRAFSDLHKGGGAPARPLRLHHQHPWDVSPAQAREIQNQLRGYIVVESLHTTVTHVAGVDVGFEADNTITRAAVAVLDVDSLALVDSAIARVATSFPYVPGLLSFREIPAVLAALERLTIWPELLLCDGQGMAHPRRLGIASHLGVLLDMPSIGVAKSRLIGEMQIELPPDKGAWVPLIDKGETIGAVLRSRGAVAPLYVSVGHRICLEQAVAWVMRCLTRYRLPETTRWAHRLASGPASD